VVAVVDSELAEIRQDTFRIMTATYPQLREEVETMAEARRAQNQEAAGRTLPFA
jgi:CRP-like cAMP-binding protein